MKFDMIVSGVGGQGILSISFVVDNAALEENLHFKQSEVHGMAQRGGAVVSHLRVSDKTIYSDLVPTGKADIILSMEPLETLRYLNYLSNEGIIVSSISPFENIPNYPEIGGVFDKLQSQENHTLVNSSELARAAGSHFAQNIVMLGAASHVMPMENKTMEKFIGVLFQAKGEKIVNVNVNAFRYGALAGEFYRKLLGSGMDLRDLAVIATKALPETYTDADVEAWKGVLAKAGKGNMLEWLKGRSGLIKMNADQAAAMLELNFEEATTGDFEDKVIK